MSFSEKSDLFLHSIFPWTVIIKMMAGFRFPAVDPGFPVEAFQPCSGAPMSNGGTFSKKKYAKMR